MPLSTQIIWLFVMVIPIACIAWTVTNEELFREPRDYFVLIKVNSAKRWFNGNSYLFTCGYCFSHYVTILFLIFTRYTLLITDWRGYVISGFALVWIANTYMSLFAFLRQGIKKEKTEITILAKTAEEPAKEGGETEGIH
jgi:hypothetical protein